MPRAGVSPPFTRRKRRSPGVIRGNTGPRSLSLSKRAGPPVAEPVEARPAPGR